MLRKLITVLVASAAVGLTAFNALAADKKVTIYLLPKIKGVPYFETCAKGAAEAAKTSSPFDLAGWPQGQGGRMGEVSIQSQFRNPDGARLAASSESARNVLQ